MTTTATDTTIRFDHVAELERSTFTREFQADLAAGDGRTLETRIAPYNTPATVADPPTFTPYQEMFVPGAFERQVSSPDRVKIWLNFEHDQGLRGIVGHGTELHDRADGLHGVFRVHDGPDGDKALSLVGGGLLTGLSLEFAALRSRRVDGVIQRERVHIDKVSLCRFPAYEGAEVIAVRTEPLEEPPAANPAIDEALQRIGYVPLAQLEPVTADELIRATTVLIRSHTSLDEKAAAARQLLRLYNAADVIPPEHLTQLARA